MPSVRYWRIVSIETQGGDLALGDIALYSGGVRVDSSATFTSTIAPITAGRWAAEDIKKPGFALLWDFGVDTYVDEVGLTATVGSNFPQGFMVQFSWEGSRWGDPLTFYGINYPGDGLQVRGFWLDEPTLPPVDPFEADVLLRLRMEDMVGSATLVDTSPNPKTVTVQGSLSGIVVEPKHGASSFYKGPSAGNGASISNPEAFAFGRSDFTIEVWIRRPTVSQVYPISFAKNDATSSQGWYFSVGPYTGIMINGYVGTPSISFPTPLLDTTNWVFVSLCRSGDIFMAHVDGVFIGSKESAASFSTTAVPTGSIGSYSYTLSNTVPVYIDDLRITKAARYTTDDYVPPDLTFFSNPNLSPVRLARVGLEVPPRTSEISLYQNPPWTVQVPSRSSSFDVMDGGLGTITGTVKLAPNVPMRRRVRLYDELMWLVRETWSDPVTGVYEFRGLTELKRYTVVAYDHLNEYRALVMDRVEVQL